MNRFSPIPLADGGQDQGHFTPFTLASDTSSLSCSFLFNTSQEQGANDRDHHLQQGPDDHMMISKSSDHLASFPTNNNNNNNNTIEESSDDRYVSHEDLQGPNKWMSSKMRFMRKMMNSKHVVMSKTRRNMKMLQDRGDSKQESSTSNNSSNSPSGIIRVCSDCNTTKTPLWRSGPRGPKSLCNACGIRQRKARRAMAAAAASGGLIPSEAPGKMRKEKKSDVDRTMPFKKRFKNAIATTTQKKLCFDDVIISLNESSAVHRVFPQDERDAALLLMALSWGIICS